MHWAQSRNWSTYRGYHPFSPTHTHHTSLSGTLFYWLHNTLITEAREESKEKIWSCFVRQSSLCKQCKGWLRDVHKEHISENYRKTQASTSLCCIWKGQKVFCKWHLRIKKNFCTVSDIFLEGGLNFCQAYFSAFSSDCSLKKGTNFEAHYRMTAHEAYNVYVQL